MNQINIRDGQARIAEICFEFSTAYLNSSALLNQKFQTNSLSLQSVGHCTCTWYLSVVTLIDFFFLTLAFIFATQEFYFSFLSPLNWFVENITIACCLCLLNWFCAGSLTSGKYKGLLYKPLLTTQSLV